MEINADVLIVGSGVAGLYCALNLREDLNIVIVSKTKITETNTYLAQGGISTARDEKDIIPFIEDTLRAGRYKNKKESVSVMAEESIDNILSIIELGVNLDKVNGNLLFTREGAHSINRIVHSKDMTGKVLADTFIKQVKKRKNITFYEDTYLIDILKCKGKCAGGILIKDNKQLNLHSKVVVLATGGIGGIFNNSTNQRHLTGDGIAIALKNNIKLKDLQYIQFHPTALYDSNIENRRFLISEAVRGEGGKLLNLKGERFVNELLPRDVVAEAIYKEISKSGLPYVFLDISFLNADYIKNRFPSIFKECLSRGIDITREPIPVSPAQHYFMGGIEVDLKSRTSMEDLYAVGETSCTGVHGANRLASNSLLEGLVFSKRAAQSINKKIDKTEFVKVFTKRIYHDVDILKKQTRKLVIEEFKRRSSKLNDELFNYR
ncbi:L-aspartate oxidase [Clostridium sp. SYSU_GA19001]|uniref:L-aspartate oxidase n=1 Tax=Clostridium caldaquaticum TaxID=2940653 RepID=UPI00207753E9|nr:L-aspartate oxidase [Clostridium caldaquaticum]MCM8709863.1 L-aspartate oxidase [Clostridium caldaquaticum]